MATIHTRYGDCQRINELQDDTILRNLIQEQRTEHLALPDNEHAEV
jgi:hypothetical protein